MIAQDIARICHEANRAYCLAHGDLSQPEWEHAPEWQRESAINGVKFHLANRAAGHTTTPEQSHENWLEEKRLAGWRYGPLKDAEAKTHPCFLPYDQLPEAQRIKDHLFGGIVAALAPFV